MPADTTPDSNRNKNQTTADLRRLKRTQRQMLPASTQRYNGQAVCKNLIREKAYRNSQHIGCYLANDGEIDPFLIVGHARFLGKKIYLPILSPLKNSLYFAPYEEGSKLRINRFNIPEPVCKPSQWKTANQLDLLLLPLVAFDTQGNRIGMGGGFYDRTLAYLHHRRFWKKPTLVGLAHEIQKAEQLEKQSWDIPLNFIVTEKQRYTTEV